MERISYNEAEKKILELIDLGYDVFPVYFPKTAECGVSWSIGSDYHVANFTIRWPIFDVAYNTVETSRVNSIEDVIEFISSNDEVFLGDKPGKLLFGFIAYDHDKKKSIIKEISLADVKDSERRDEFIKIREGLMSKWDELIKKFPIYERLK